MERRFFRDVVLAIAAILLFVAGANYVIDPFRRNGRFDLCLPKDTTSRTIDYRLYKSLAFATRPQPVLVLGDSRCAAWTETILAEAGEPRAYNFAFGGGTLQEAIDAFWFADARARLERVYLCVPFALYSAASESTLMPQARAIADDAVRYYLSPLVSEASFANVHDKLVREPWQTERPAMDREAFWRHQLDRKAAKELREWAPPQTLLPELERLAQRCRERGIELWVVIPPGHVELQAKAAELGLAREYAAYRCELARIAPVLDFDVDTALTRDRSAFLDPYHLTEDAVRRVVRQVVTRDTRDARVLPFDPTGARCAGAAGGSSPEAQDRPSTPR